MWLRPIGDSFEDFRRAIVEFGGEKPLQVLDREEVVRASCR
jgi:DNA-directed RNA polymerase subunit N (RpoN/RPB10)